MAKRDEAKRLLSLSPEEQESVRKAKEAAKLEEATSKKKAREDAKARERSLEGKIFRLHPVNEEHIGSATILYANVHGFADYLTIKGSADDSCFAERHPRYTLDYSKVKLTKR